MKTPVLLTAAAFLACWTTTIPAHAGNYDETVHGFITASQQTQLARAALAQYGVLPDTGRGPEVDLRIKFPSDQSGLENITTVMLVPVNSGAHQCESIAVKNGGTEIDASFGASKDVRPGHLYDVVVTDAVHDKYWAGRILVSKKSLQQFTLRAPLLGPDSKPYGGPGSAPPPKLGLFGETITPVMLRSAHANPQMQGVLVLGLWPGSAAQRAGFEPGDIVLSIDGRSVFSMEQLIELENSLNVSVLRFDIFRGGRGFTLNVSLVRDSGWRSPSVGPGLVQPATPPPGSP